MNYLFILLNMLMFATGPTVSQDILQMLLVEGAVCGSSQRAATIGLDGGQFFYDFWDGGIKL
jgi:hypothetical protein